MRLIFLILILPFYVFPQKTQWLKCYGGSDIERVKQVISFSDTNYLILGSSQSSDGDIKYITGWKDGFLLSINSRGYIIKATTFGGNHDAEFNGGFATEDSDMILYGYINTGNTPGNLWVLKVRKVDYSKIWEKIYEDTLTKRSITGGGRENNSYLFWGESEPISNANDIDIVILKTDINGKKLFEKTYGGSYRDDVLAIFPDSNKSHIVFANTDSKDGDIKKYYDSTKLGSYNIWIYKFDSNGDIKWQKIIGGKENDKLYKVFKQNDGYILTGATESNNGDFVKTGNDYDIFIVKIDFKANIVWQKIIGVTGKNDYFSDAFLKSDSNMIIVGNTIMSKGDGIIYSEVTKAGKVLWAKILADSISQTPHCIFGLKDNYFISGIIDHYDTIKKINKSYLTLYVLREDNLKLAKYFNCGGEIGSIIKFGYLCQDTSMILFGNTYSNEYDFKSSHGFVDIFACRLSLNPTSVFDYPCAINLNIYPNPATNSIHLSGISNQSAIEIRDIQGRVLRAINNGELKINDNIDISTFIKGMYILTVKNAEGVWAGKFVKE